MTVVVTTDGSEESLTVLSHGARLGRALNEELVLLRVLDPLLDAKGVLAPSLHEAVKIVTERWQAELEQVLAVREAGGKVHIAHRVHGEETPDTVLNAARSLGASVIALHSHGAGKLRRAFVGSIAMEVLKKAEHPLLVSGPESQPPHNHDPYHVFFAFDGSPAGDAALDRIGPVVEQAKARVTMFQATLPTPHAVGNPTDAAAARQHLEGLAGRYGGPGEVGIGVGEAPAPAAIPELVIEEARAVGANAIAMSTHGHSARYQIAAGSVAVGVVSRSPMPVLLARAPRPK